MKRKDYRVKMACAVMTFAFCFLQFSQPYDTVVAAEPIEDGGAETEYDTFGGGYAASNQLEGVGFTTEVYDASNGLPTSDAMFLLGANDGSIWIGGYSGVIRYDGN
ncbi:MAG: hypothetical protein II020_05530, partial [Lachnospiraceae bacterium]|nr:hypothetical protein [Lachnospiraceae bacterium]